MKLKLCYFLDSLEFYMSAFYLVADGKSEQSESLDGTGSRLQQEELHDAKSMLKQALMEENQMGVSSSSEKVHICPYCTYSCDSEMRIQAHVLAQHTHPPPQVLILYSIHFTINTIQVLECHTLIFRIDVFRLNTFNLI